MAQFESAILFFHLLNFVSPAIYYICNLRVDYDRYFNRCCFCTYLQLLSL